MWVCILYAAGKEREGEGRWWGRRRKEEEEGKGEADKNLCLESINCFLKSMPHVNMIML